MSANNTSTSSSHTLTSRQCEIVRALTTAYKKDHEGVENVIVEVNEVRKDLRMYVQKVSPPEPYSGSCQPSKSGSLKMISPSSGNPAWGFPSKKTRKPSNFWKNF